jgi:hypothetical protein
MLLKHFLCSYYFNDNVTVLQICHFARIWKMSLSYNMAINLAGNIVFAVTV